MPDDDKSDSETPPDTEGAAPAESVLVWIGGAAPPAVLRDDAERFSEVVHLEPSSPKPQHIVEALRSSGAADRRVRMSMQVGFDPSSPVVPSVAMYEALAALSSRRPDVIRAGPGPTVQAETLRRRIADMRKKLVSLRGSSGGDAMHCLQVAAGPTSAPAPAGLESVVLNDPSMPFSRVAADIMRARHVRLAVSDSPEESVIALVVVSTLRKPQSKSARPYLVQGHERYRPESPEEGSVDLNTVYAGVNEVRKNETSKPSVTVLPYEPPSEVLRSIQAVSAVASLDVVLGVIGSVPVGTDPTRWTCPKLPTGIVGRSCPRMPRHIDISSVDPSDQGLTRQQSGTVQCSVCDTSPVDPLRLYSESRMVSMYDAPVLLQREVDEAAAT